MKSSFINVNFCLYHAHETPVVYILSFSYTHSQCCTLTHNIARGTTVIPL